MNGIILIVIIVISLILANEFYSIAKIKGYTQAKYFWYCFLFGIFGYLLIIALPNRIKNLNDDNKKNIIQSDDLPLL